MNSPLEAPPKPLEGKPLPSISAEFREYPCPVCNVLDWVIRPDGTMYCHHCAIHLLVSKNWCPRCGTMRG